MNALLRTQKGKIGGGVGGLLVVIAASWFLLVSPQRAKSNELDLQLISARAELSQRRLALAQPSAALTVKPSDLYRLTKALPNAPEMAGILLDVDRIAGRNDLQFSSIVPATEHYGAGYVEHPLSVVVQGRFGNVSRFLGDLRRIVKVKRGRLDARGRIYTVSQVDITQPEADKKFPVVRATVMLSAYSFSAPVPGTTSPSTTAATSANGTVAAGATP